MNPHSALLTEDVFTTSFVLDMKQPIIFVNRDKNDGSWQFLSADKTTDFVGTARIIVLSEIIAMDASIKDVLQMNPGNFATRERSEDPWIIHSGLKN